ncbi:DUF732 domain-containing protein [Mycobacteroides abscessus subsp. abscessus]|uniref:DUF732 domain-containing protein n=1 Tax=Mycobacteroides abscessus subsp. bolletii 50594 TaxID=1303024 RepID=A0AB33A8H8_9MYCO|nr:hypothetical protein MASS_1525 [Mycobacteroides abscessus subsp. bolletii 50594]EUA77313.1 hypothetical protein I541_1775 [Mycobacteroides abscessus]QSN27690.1 DUF732 domain-containing protein [Mycobacteroides abscessus subsp. abscessus]QSN32995.1 DUF732 domain-containing protein [Mycobacteroides abscessus subsp. abscessus]SIK37389.1 Protein of uncharacterised function (DUF732) [Mycobacteroides abscessus subsp. abscessus]
MEEQEPTMVSPTALAETGVVETAPTAWSETEEIEEPEPYDDPRRRNWLISGVIFAATAAVAALAAGGGYVFIQQDRAETSTAATAAPPPPVISSSVLLPPTPIPPVPPKALQPPPTTLLAPQPPADEVGFIASIQSLDHYAITCARCAQDAIKVGYRACRGFDTGGSVAAINAVKSAYNSDSDNSDYYATLFAQYASVHLCPQHQGEIGPI